MKIFIKMLCVVMIGWSVGAFADPSKSYLLISGNSNRELAQKISDELGVKLTNAEIGRFNDGEISVKINESVRGKNVYVIQPTSSSPKASVNDNIMELLLTVRALKRASAGSVIAVIPYYGYARQDRKTTSRVPISASDMAIFLEAAGVDRVVAVDLHAGQIQGFFHKAPVDNLYASASMVPYFVSKKLDNLVVVSPDAGGVERAKFFREQLAKQGVDSELAIFIKQREKAGKIDRVDLVGSVKDKNVIIVDDMCDTGGTLCATAEELKKLGAKNIYASITHPVFSGSALEKIGKSVFTEVVVTDTIPLKDKAPANIKQISVAPLLAQVIGRLQAGDSVSAVFQ